MSVMFAGAGRRVKREQRLIAWAAYQTAALTRTQKFPKFADFIGDKPAPRDHMTALRAIASRLPKVRGAPSQAQ